MFTQEFIKRGTLQELHGHKYGVSVPVEIVNRYDVRVGKCLRFTRLSLERNKGIGMLTKIIVQQFYGDVWVRVTGLNFTSVESFVNGPHTTGTQHGYEFETTFNYFIIQRRNLGLRTTCS